jgi:hypothetical protein
MTEQQYLQGITITKTNLILNQKHRKELDTCNIGIHEDSSRYILYYKPKPMISDLALERETICHLKGILTRIRSDLIYNAYNNDFGQHSVAPAPAPKVKPAIKIRCH